MSDRLVCNFVAKHQKQPINFSGRNSKIANNRNLHAKDDTIRLQLEDSGDVNVWKQDISGNWSVVQKLGNMFIDTSRLLYSGTFNNSDQVELTLSENAYLFFSGSVYVSYLTIDGIQVCTLDGRGNIIQTVPIPIKKGQTIKMWTNTYQNGTYALYGMI